MAFSCGLGSEVCSFPAGQHINSKVQVNTHKVKHLHGYITSSMTVKIPVFSYSHNSHIVPINPYNKLEKKVDGSWWLGALSILIIVLGVLGLAEYGCNTVQELLQSEAARRSKDFDIFTLQHFPRNSHRGPPRKGRYICYLWSDDQ